MSFVTTQPEALTYAAGKLESLGSSMAAESAAAAAPTTGVIPAAAEEVSALQAAIFGAYGSLYQSINAQAARIHELLFKPWGPAPGCMPQPNQPTLRPLRRPCRHGSRVCSVLPPTRSARRALPRPVAALPTSPTSGLGTGPPLLRTCSEWEQAEFCLLPMKSAMPREGWPAWMEPFRPARWGRRPPRAQAGFPCWGIWARRPRSADYRCSPVGPPGLSRRRP